MPPVSPDKTGSVTVIKVGGSLLNFPQLGVRLRALIQHVEPPVALLAGGGALADVIRQWDQTHQLGEVTSHHLALRTLSVSAHLLHTLVPNSHVVHDPVECRQVIRTGRIPIYDVSTPLLLADPSLIDQSWDFTSDSIACWLALELQSRHVVLVKSRDLPVELTSLQELANNGHVDRHFPRMASPLHISWVNLRNDPCQFDRLQ